MKKYIPLIIIICVLGLAWYFRLQDFLSFEQLRSHKEELDAFIKAHLIVAICAYILLYSLIVAASLPVAAFMSITAGILFAQMVGTMVAVISGTLGSTVFFLSTRLASKDLLKKKVGPALQKIQEGLEKDSFSYLLSLRLIPIFPFFLVNIAAAVLQLPLRTFVFATLLGIMPGAFVYVSIGVALSESLEHAQFSTKILLDPTILIALTGLGILALLPIIYRRLKRN